jgi:1-acyl-sn-glycerol-3-phosphate acyltransferase
VIRAAWVAIVAALATLFFGMIAIAGALLRVRGPLYLRATRSWSRSILRASGTRVETHGMDRVKWDSPQVLVCNHASVFDVLALSAVLPGGFSFVGKKELDSIPFFGQAWKAAGHISIDRSDRQKAVASLRQAGEKLRRERGTVILFPEGTRSRDGELLPFKKGAFMLATGAGVAVVPAVIHGSRHVVAKGGVVRRATIHVHFGDAMDPGEYAGAETFLTAVRDRMAEMLKAARSSGEASVG